LVEAHEAREDVRSRESRQREQCTHLFHRPPDLICQHAVHWWYDLYWHVYESFAEDKADLGSVGTKEILKRGLYGCIGGGFAENVRG
jgi:hypothetical protein